MLAAVAAVPRHLFVPGGPLAVRVGEHRAADRRGPDHLPAGGGRAHVRAAAADRRARRCSTSAPAPAITPRSWPISRARCGASSARPSLPSRRGATSRPPGSRTCTSIVGDGSRGLPEQAPFDAINVAAAAHDVPPALEEQLADGGRLVAPINGREQRLLLVRRRGDTFERTLARAGAVRAAGRRRES